jgi:anhydro-N-acetylmuramic acid kinase
MKKLKIIGLMSGTSLDGLDVAYVEFFKNEDKSWGFELVCAKTFEINTLLKGKLIHAKNCSALELFELDKEFARFSADCVNEFCRLNALNKDEIDAIASHGQTVFHQPENGFTVQIGCGSTIAFLADIPVINDFRTLDVIAGGQGAPLVPMGDHKLFGAFAASFLNLGGFANISFKYKDLVRAFDICPANLPLNFLVSKLGFSYDDKGNIAKSGKIIPSLLEKFNDLSFYNLPFPKSLGTEWLDSKFMPLIIESMESNEDLLCTIVEHQAIQIAKVLNDYQLNSVYITGGGAYNEFFISRLRYFYTGTIEIPDRNTIEFKEAIVFAFLGALYLVGESNTFASVTGASQDLVTGVYHRGKKGLF